MDDFFLRVMQICSRLAKNDKPRDQEILDWFSYFIYILEGYDLGTQIISHSQDSYMTMNDMEYTISNQHSVKTMGESLPEDFNPLSPECEPYNVSPSENHEHNLFYVESPIEEIPSFSESQNIHSLYKKLFDANQSHEHPLVYHVVQLVHFYFN
jgi:hypothetical protein